MEYRNVTLTLPTITKTVKYLIITNVILFFITNFAPDIAGHLVWNKSAIINNFEIWRLLTYSFININFFNLFFNMFILYIFGCELENIWGQKYFIKFYFSCILISSVLSLIYNMEGVLWGSNTVILSLITAYTIINPDRIIYFMFVFPMKIKWLLLIIAGMNLMMIKNSYNSLNYLLHINGIIAALIYLKFTTELLQFKKNIFQNQYNKNYFKKQVKKLHSDKKKYSNFNIKNVEKKNKVNDNSYYDLNEQVNNILDKIKTNGISSLNNKEKQILKKAEHIYKNDLLQENKSE